MIDTQRKAYREVAQGLFSVWQSSTQDHKCVGFDEMAYVIDEERSSIQWGYRDEQMHNDGR